MIKIVKKEYICEKGKRSSIVVEDLTVEIREGSTFILGFAGIGLIGPIVANTLIEQIPDMQEIGFVTSEYLPPISVFYAGVLKHPFRLLYSAQANLIVGICEVPFQIPTAYNDLAKTLCNWALSEDVSAKEIVIFQGIPQRGLIDDYPVFYAAEASMVDFLEKFGIKKVFTPVLEIPTPELLVF